MMHRCARTLLRLSPVTTRLCVVSRRWPSRVAFHSAASQPEPTDALLHEAKKLLENCRNVLVLTGAGISTESGVADYRSPGRPPHRPTSHQQFMASHLTRQRYWARSLQGYDTLALSHPNAGHFALAYSEKTGGPVKHIITQNVDLLHERSGSSSVLHLHGTIENLRCMSCDAISSRAEYQKQLRELNPLFIKHHEEASHHRSPTQSVQQPNDAHSHTHMHLISPSLGAHPVSLPSSTSSNYGMATSLRPDGDSNLPQDLDFSTFVLPSCLKCTDGHGNPLTPPKEQAPAYPAPEPMQHGVLKPDLVFFGANVPKHVHARADELLAACDGLLVVGTSLTVWSAFRLMHATLDRITPGHEISVVQLANLVARAVKQEEQGKQEERANGATNNTISEGAAIMNPVAAFKPQTASANSPNAALYSRRVPSVLPIVILNQGPTRADPLVAAASNLIKVDNCRASQALKFILGVPDNVAQEPEEGSQRRREVATATQMNIE